MTKETVNQESNVYVAPEVKAINVKVDAVICVSGEGKDPEFGGEA